jgi:hypothetical protein
MTQIINEPLLDIAVRDFEIERLNARIAELEAENTKFRAMYNDLQLTTAYNAGFEKGVKHQKNAQVAEAALENKND